MKITRGTFFSRIGLVVGTVALTGVDALARRGSVQASPQRGTWEQEAFDKADRRAAKRQQARVRQEQGDKRQDLIRLDCAPADKTAVVATVHQLIRHSDVVHGHEEAVILACGADDAPGLRRRLEGSFAAKTLKVEMRHGTFSSATDIAENAESLKKQ